MSGKGPLGEYVMRIPGIRYARGPYIQEKLILGELGLYPRKRSYVRGLIFREIYCYVGAYFQLTT